MNQTNKLVNKIKDIEIEQSKEKEDLIEDDSVISINKLTEENLDEYLENVETDEYSKELLQKYLDKKKK
ncbi:MAG: hypothetical protein IJJ47_00195 [Methanosphaera sp.]|nr:hypothetical protein [Methanosphaera sp.]